MLGVLEVVGLTLLGLVGVGVMLLELLGMVAAAVVEAGEAD